MLTCVEEMLRLVSNKKCSPTAAAAATTMSTVGPPPNIILHDRLMTFGRSYKADIKIMLPYISRKHFTVSTLHVSTGQTSCCRSTFFEHLNFAR